MRAMRSLIWDRQIIQCMLYFVELSCLHILLLINWIQTYFASAKPSDFEFLSVVGKGSFGKVYQANHKLENKIYAIKVLNKKEIIRRNEVNHIMAERNVLIRNLQHPFLVGLHYSFQSADKLYFVLDYVNGGEVILLLLYYFYYYYIISCALIFYFEKKSFSIIWCKKECSQNLESNSMRPKSRTPSATCTRRTSFIETWSRKTFSLTMT